MSMIDPGDMVKVCVLKERPAIASGGEPLKG